ncbi:extracellular solute-binding protein [Agrobacterium tumefaciens]|uniref:extracellular solute-binding protein n=1 Tax=Agrobacterium tumefaciens TaxID=358 RepID=UPI00157268BA|nr:extracellular solute-binding protein [Agrobacterium tumefaciens]NTE65127.1 extracellular solute-binding protein [Agrobacterium tumefaciens]
MYLRLFAATLFASVALVAPTWADEITIKVDATPAIFAKTFKKLVTAFELEHPTIHVELDTSQRDQTDTIQRTMRQAVVGDLPDVSFQGFNYLRLLTDGGNAQPLDDLIAVDKKWSDQYSASVTTAATIDGKVYGLGAALSFPIIFYNADLVAETQGGNKELPGDWEGILAVAKKIQNAHPQLLGAYTLYNSAMIQGYLMSSGGALGSSDGRSSNLTDEKGLAVFDLFRSFGEAGQAKNDMTIPQARQAFTSGTIGILVDSSSGLQGFAEQAKGHFSLDTAHFPFAIDNPRLPTFGTAMVLHTADPVRKQAAWQFMRFVAGPSGQNIVGRMTGYVPANEVAIDRTDLLGDYYKANPAIQAALASIPHAAPWYAFKGANAARIDTLLGERMQRVVTLQEKPGEAARALSDEISGLIAP